MPALAERPSDAACRPCEVVTRADLWRLFASTGRTSLAGGAQEMPTHLASSPTHGETSGSRSCLRLPTARGGEGARAQQGPAPVPHSFPLPRPVIRRRSVPVLLPQLLDAQILGPSSSFPTCLPCPSIFREMGAACPIRLTPTGLGRPRPFEGGQEPPIEPERGRFLPWAGASR